jgi:hypothetical protein
MDWNSYVMQTYAQLKAQHGEKVTFKHALVAAKEPYRKMRADLFAVRKDIAHEQRNVHARRARGPKRQAHLDRADRIEAHAYAGLLEDFATEYD